MNTTTIDMQLNALQRYAQTGEYREVRKAARKSCRPMVIHSPGYIDWQLTIEQVRECTGAKEPDDFIFISNDKIIICCSYYICRAL